MPKLDIYNILSLTPISEGLAKQQEENSKNRQAICLKPNQTHFLSMEQISYRTHRHSTVVVEIIINKYHNPLPPPPINQIT